MRSTKNYLLNLNLFKPPADSGEIEDEHQHYSNILATRVYLAILPLALITIALYSWLSIQTAIVTLQYPTKEQFEVLPLDAHCACSRISLAYGEFTSIQSTFHQVCSSDFVSDRWIKTLFAGSVPVYGYPKPGDFRHLGSAQFQALAGFCRLSELNFQQSIASFKTSTLLSSRVLSETALQSQTQAFIHQLQLTAPNTFKSQLQQVRELTLSNQLLSGLQTNGLLQLSLYQISNQYKIYRSNVKYTSKDGVVCDCDTEPDCMMPAVIYLHESGGWTSAMDIAGFLAGCMPVNSVLFSTLECFYNQTCLDKLISFFPTTEKFRAMGVVEQSQFTPNWTMKSIVERLMVEKWTTHVFFDKYYAQCAPISCIYSEMKRHDFLFVLKNLIGVLSGCSLFTFQVIPCGSKVPLALYEDTLFTE